MPLRVSTRDAHKLAQNVDAPRDAHENVCVLAEGYATHSGAHSTPTEHAGHTLLALDISSTAIGYVVLDGTVVRNRGTRLLKSKCLQTRVTMAYHALRLLLDEVQPTHLAYEGAAYHAQPLALIAQQNVVGVLLLLCEQRGLTAIAIPPAAAKKALTGQGNAPKAAMVAATQTAFGTLRISEHEADALGVALAVTMQKVMQ